ncbi:MAG: hypothetical protein ACREAY_01160 [Nitrososphaera sp.]|uniref:hypothetical protein n=1 Tax=Nitrososphaera sp. TaxID=1971748 RepID=UPI003D6FCD34
MPKRNFATLEEFKANLHQEGATLVEFSGGKVPCILVSPKKYEEMLGKVYGKRVSADTLLDIFYDGQDVFVDVNVKFAGTDFEENFLLYANDMLEFFDALAESGIVAMGPSENTYANSQNVFMIQLPKKDAAQKALAIIKANAKSRTK